MNLFEKIRSFFTNPSYPRTLTLVGLLIIALALPVTLTILGQTTHVAQFAYQPGPTPSPPSGNNCGYTGESCGGTGSNGKIIGCCLSSDYCYASQYCRTKCTQSAPFTTCHGIQQCTAVNNYNGLCGITNYTGCKYVPNQCGYTAPATPTVTSCKASGSNFTATISWQQHDLGVSSVDISQSSSFNNPIYSAHVTTNSKTSVNAPADFNNSLTLSQTSTYYVRTYDGHLHSAPVKFTYASCGPPPPTPTPPLPADAIRCGPGNVGVCFWQSKNAATQCQEGNTAQTDSKKDACVWVNFSTPMPRCDQILASGAESTTNTDVCNIGQNYNNGTNYRCCYSGSLPTPVPATPTPKLDCTPVCTSPSSCKQFPGGGQQGPYCGGGATTPEFWCVPAGCSPVKETPTPTPGGGNGKPTPTPIPCKNGKTTQLALSLKLPGIGTGSFENPSPKHPDRTAISVKVVNQTGSAIYDSKSMKFSHSKGRFNVGTFSLGTKLTCGNTYTVNVKLATYLTATATVTYGASQTLNIDLIPGDINYIDPSTKQITGDGKITVNDYAILTQCHNADPTKVISWTEGSATVGATCGDLMNFFDYSDGGTTGDEWANNYNLWLRGFIQANGYKI